MPDTQHPTPNTQGPPLIALTLGDAAGVGPEVAVKAALSPEVRRLCQPLLVGPRAAAEETVHRLALPARLEAVDRPRLPEDPASATPRTTDATSR